MPDDDADRIAALASGAEPPFLSGIVDQAREKFAPYEQPDGAFIDPQPAEPRGPGRVARLLQRIGLRS